MGRVAVSPRLKCWRQGGREFIWRGHRLFFKDEGSGPAVLLLHGYPTGSFDWHAQWPMLVPHFRLIAPDFLGLGFSDKPPQHDYTLSNHAEAVDDLLASLGLADVRVVAHDLGVRVAQEMLATREAQQASCAVKSLVLLNGAMCPEAYRPRMIQRLLASPMGAWLGPRIPRAAFDRALRELFGKQTPPPLDLLDDFWSLVELGEGRRVTHAVGRFWQPHLAMRDRLVGALLRSRVALRIINGAADPNSGRHMVARWLALAPHTDVVSLEGIGHWPQIEDARGTAGAILDFLGA
ncbi:MAG: alpha/beta hydrolase [Leptothrix sp. (in: Bacteria)]|nr:alpha/beta hydrolase [Leptothrix sp. (in: b-proteobacteria)]